jgi:hypothetical protein
MTSPGRGQEAGPSVCGSAKQLQRSFNDHFPSFCLKKRLFFQIFCLPLSSCYQHLTQPSPCAILKMVPATC